MTRPGHIYMTHVVCVRLSASLSIYLYVYILNKFCSVHPFVLSGSREISTNTSFIDKLKMLRQLHDPSHKIRFSDLVDLWVIKKKKSMILCARSTWRLSEQSTKCRSRRHIFEEFMRCAKVCGLFSWLCFSDADWLGRQIPTTWRTSTYIRFSYQSVS